MYCNKKIGGDIMERVLMKGNEAIAEAAIQAGCRAFFGYPITPQNQIPEYMSKRMPEVDGVFLQAESEISAINMVYGAAGAGARVMTSSSSPGISLKQEGISYIAGAELPCVIVNIVRGGPGLGSIQAAQSDYFQATKGGGHGDYHLITLSPSTVQEAYDLVQLAFDLSDKYRVPSMILGDGMLGQMMEPVKLKNKEIKKTPIKSWATDGIFEKGRERNIINSLYIEMDEIEELNKRLQNRYSKIKNNEVMFEEYNTKDAEFVIVAYGTVARIVKNSIEVLKSKGINVGLLRPITLWPFPDKAIQGLCKKNTIKGFLTVEMSAGQMVEDVRLAVEGKKRVELLSKLGSTIPEPKEIVDKILDMKEGF
eukprot:TRINITY_DN305_c0_g1_i4.p1 TRINITY_DN305_c0_g1~~TRINITY_DN305_c0_g1_i4.p1  ORF type:complete len:367 (+),score=-25.41 TRINITY_DN305_c0_g1_i4:169-1269(+)